MLWKPLLLCLALFPARLLSGPDDALAEIRHLPETNPYRASLERLASLTEEDQQALRAWASPAEDEPAPALTPNQQAIAQELTAALVQAAKQPSTTAADWPRRPNPNTPDDPSTTITLGVSHVRQLAKIAAKTADSLPPRTAIETYAAVAQFGRQRREGKTLIEQLVGVAIDGIALAEISKRLPEFSAADLQHAAQIWAQLKPAPPLETVLEGERDTYFLPMVEHSILPGLKALLAEEADAAGEPTPADAADSAPLTSFAQDLRLSGLVNLGTDDYQIFIENLRTGESFAIQKDKIVESIELLEIDFEKKHALIKHGEETAIIYLQSKRIVARRPAADRFRKMFGFMDTFGMTADEDADAEKSLHNWLNLVKSHPKGPEGYAADLVAVYQASVQHQIEGAAKAQIDSSDKPETSPDPFVNLIAPTFGKVARTLQNTATQSAMLQAVIAQRLSELGVPGTSSAPADPWSETGEPFSVEKTPDGGVLLRSRYEAAPGHPFTYKFAAPDAGYVRPR